MTTKPHANSPAGLNMGQNFYQMYGGSGAHMQGSLPDFGGSIDRGSFPFFMGGGYGGYGIPKNGSFERSSNSSFVQF